MQQQRPLRSVEQAIRRELLLTKSDAAMRAALHAAGVLTVAEGA